MWSASLQKIDSWLDGQTMYRVTIFYLAALLAIATFLAATGRMGYSPQSLVLQTGMLIVACLVGNYVMAWWVGAPMQWEPTLITALILALIIGPVQDGQREVVLWAAGLSIASKYVLASGMRQWFNPAAIGAVLLELGGHSASWWVGTGVMLPWVIIGGLLLVRKLRRERLVSLFLLIGVGVSAIFELAIGNSWSMVWRHTVLSSPLWFLGFVMLTEPTTLPPTRGWRSIYAALVAVLSWPFLQIGGVAFTPEMALVTGNMLNSLVAWRPKAYLQLYSKTEVTPGIWDFAFVPSELLKFRAGQYLDWVVDHTADSRGKRRMFTVASSPTEKLVHLGFKVVPDGSSYKRALIDMRPGENLVAGSAAGDFVLPRKPKKMAWVAGGIGITPYRSMVRYLIDAKQSPDTVLLYAAPNADQLAYADVFSWAAAEGWLLPVAFVPDGQMAAPWQTVNGRIDAKSISQTVPDYKERVWYISGSQSMVSSVKDALRSLGVSRRQIKTDYFAGLS